MIENIITPQFDYNYLIGLFSKYKYPRNKIGSLLHSGKIIRVKKGLYVKGTGGYCLPLLANMIYGPSYVSQDYALSQFGLIPERVYVVTSMTTGRTKNFRTPIGDFSYETISAKMFAVGIKRKESDDGCSYLIATPEKALVDRIWKDKNIKTIEDLENYLLYDLRLTKDVMKEFSIKRLKEIANIVQKLPSDLLLKLLLGWKRR